LLSVLPGSSVPFFFLRQIMNNVFFFWVLARLPGINKPHSEMHMRATGAARHHRGPQVFNIANYLSSPVLCKFRPNTAALRMLATNRYNACCRDRGKRIYERRDMERVLSSQLDLTMQFRAARCRDDPLARRLLVCATNMMCLLDPLQRCRIDDILREIDM
jgi:hypothetical protein